MAPRFYVSRMKVSFPSLALATGCVAVLLAVSIPTQIFGAVQNGPSGSSIEDFSKFNTADALWAHIESLLNTPGGSSQEGLGRFLNISAALSDYLNRYPGDSHRWEAKYAQVQINYIIDTARSGRSAYNLAKFEVGLKGVANAFDAPKEIQAAASKYRAARA